MGENGAEGAEPANVWDRLWSRNQWIEMPRRKRVRWALVLLVEMTVVAGVVGWLLGRVGDSPWPAWGSALLVWGFFVVFLAQVVRAPERVRSWTRSFLRWAIIVASVLWVGFLVALYVAD